MLPNAWTEIVYDTYFLMLQQMLCMRRCSLWEHAYRLHSTEYTYHLDTEFSSRSLIRTIHPLHKKSQGGEDLKREEEKAAKEKAKQQQRSEIGDANKLAPWRIKKDEDGKHKL